MGGKNSTNVKYSMKQDVCDGTKRKHRKPLSPLSSHRESKKSPASTENDKTGNTNSTVEKNKKYPELFESEKESDVTFLVGEYPNVWRFPAHKKVLCPYNQVFDAMLSGPLSSKVKKELIPVEDVEPKAFENLLRFVYIGELKILSIQVALDTLLAADKYMMREIISICLNFLDVNMGVNDVLKIYPYFFLFASAAGTRDMDIETVVALSSASSTANNHRNNLRPEAPSTNVAIGLSGYHQAASPPYFRRRALPVEEINPYIPLLNKCLEMIDNFAEKVLTSEDFELLSKEVVSDIVFRDSLQVNSELTVFDALQRWSTQQCKSSQKEMTSENKRKALKSALYSVRYLLMSREEFLRGPCKSDLLRKEESAWLLSRIESRQDTEPPMELQGRLRYFERRRGVSHLMVTHRTLLHHSAGGAGAIHQFTPSASLLHACCEQTKKKTKCDKISKVFTECFLCFSLFFD